MDHSVVQTTDELSIILHQKSDPTFPNIFLPFMAASAAAASLCSKNSTKQ